MGLGPAPGTICTARQALRFDFAVSADPQQAFCARYTSRITTNTPHTARKNGSQYPQTHMKCATHRT
eukprot:2394265-Rhodomonas_salina.1